MSEFDDNMQDRFIGEASELVELLQEHLLVLDKSPDNEENIKEIFRVLHTLKGSAAMFGFENIGALSHNIENIYAEIRDGNRRVSREIIDITFQVTDNIKKLLDSKDHVTRQKQNELDDIMALIDQLLGLETEEITTENESSARQKFFYILFTPDKEVYSRGINPFDMFEDLSDIGELTVNPLGVKEDQIDRNNFIQKWEIVLTGQSSVDEINGNFIFYMEDEYQVISFDPSDIDNQKEMKQAWERHHKKPFDSVEFYERFKERLDQQGAKEEVDKSLPDEDIPGKSPDKIKVDKQNSQPENKLSSIRVASDKLDELINLVSELVIINSQLTYIAEGVNNIQLKKIVSNVEKLSKNLRDNTLGLRLVPIQTLAVKFSRLVRDLSHKLNKQIEFVTEGTDTELDSNIISKIEGPLMHIIRNSIDHGIEDEKERTRKNKPSGGVIRLIAFYSGASVFIQVQDDGRGINPQDIKQKAIDKGIIKPTDNLSNKELFDLIFLPGFSTANTLSEVSGRGVGMDVVKRNITELRGEIEVDSEVDLGTSISLKLPLTLSIIDALQVSVNEISYLVPLSAIESCRKILSTELFSSGNQQVEYEDELIPYIDLRKEFELGGDIPRMENLIIISHQERKYALVVDKVIGEHQAVVKPLGYMHRDQEFITGASIMGDGSLALILDTFKLVFKLKQHSYNIK